MNPFDLEQHIRNNRRLDVLKNFEHKTLQELKPEYIDNNVLNVDLDTPIYRLFNEEYFYQMLEQQQLTLVRTSCWQDPFENFLLGARWETVNGTPINVASTRDRYYGQCWTLRKECDGMWRNYRGARKDKDGPEPFAFKVATTVRKLMDQFYNISEQFHELSYFMGKVQYCTDEQIQQFFSEPEHMNTAAHQANLRYTETLFIKRMPFSYEEEVRLIYSDNLESTRHAVDKGKLYPVLIDANTLYDFIELDPWMKEPEREAAEARIKAAGYGGLITQSGLYTNPNFVVKLAVNF
ncbi:hypothetical protein LRS06_21790 [Hymenobacter sp. J193]|uniref:DUF2971 domain-containing protein n=1 Tax=Hymenobacter sp. J193 TaxID=2898429 RepID=UPI0021507360|nr:hypothetical protein [Hymenobacter sp. J193]MCR5890363.1 hypothetical protein [Hymenobacter sp. J193]